MVTWRWWWWTTARATEPRASPRARGAGPAPPARSGTGFCTQRRRRTRQGACVHRCRLCARTGLAGRRMQRPDPGRHRAGAHRAPPTSRTAGAHGACRGGDRAVRERQPGRAARRVRARGRIPSGPRRSGGRTLRGRRLVRLDGGARVVFCPESRVLHAVEPRGARAVVAERARLRFFPALTAQRPELRDTFERASRIAAADGECDRRGCPPALYSQSR